MFSRARRRNPRGANRAEAPTARRTPDAPVVDPRPSAASVAAVIVTYHPDSGLSDRVRPLVGQVGAIVIVDNGSTEAELAPAAHFVRTGSAEAIRNGRNLGIAAALNQGLAWAAEHEYAWALTLDQDTTPEPDVVSEAARVFDAFPDPFPAVIGAAIKVPQQTPAAPTTVGRQTTCVISAGALHSVAAWRAIGGFREDFFIDYVDFEYCLRARGAGYAVAQAGRPTISHAIGRPTRHRTPLRSFTTSNHDRTRRYYSARNRVIVWRTYTRTEWPWVVRDMTAAAKELVKLALAEEDRRGKLRAVVRGCRDGLAGGRAHANPGT